MLAYYGPEWESLASRMVDRWCTSFSGNTGLQFPSTMGRNHGVLTNFANNGNTSYVASQEKLALQFNGTNNHVDFGDVLNFERTQPFAIAAWVRARSFASAGSIANKMQSANLRGYLFFYNTDATVGFILRSASAGNRISVATTGAALTLNVWAHVVVVYNGTSQASGVRFFANGDSMAASIAENTLSATTVNSQSLLIGGRAIFNDLFVSAEIDDTIIFNTALTSNEVRFIYDQGRGGGLLYQPPRRRSVAAVIAALVLACETGNYSLTGQAAGLFASRVLAADQAQYILSGNAANTTASRLLSADPASYTADGNDAATICARLLDGGAAAYALTGTDAGLIANRKLTADQAVCFLAGNNAELLRSLKLNAGSMALQLDNFAASLLADRKISADGAQYILVVSDANLTGSASGVAPYYYLFMMRGPQ
jgi:hypothetical protein